MLEITRGNRIRLKYKLKVDGDPVGDYAALTSATRIVWAVKTCPDDANVDAVIIVEGAPDLANVIEIDTPDVNWVTITLNSSVTQVDPEIYFYALQVEWGSDNRLEFKFGDGKLKVLADVIR